MKRTFTGWVGKESKDWIKAGPDIIDIAMCTIKGRQIEWLEEQWPPVKVKITVETITTRRTGRSRPAGAGAGGNP